MSDVWRMVLAFGLMLAIWRGTRLLVVDEFPPTRALRRFVIYAFGVVENGSIVDGRGWKPRMPYAQHEPTAGFTFALLVSALLRGVTWSIAYIWTCPWCMSIWLGAAVVWAADWRLSVPYPPLIVAAASLLTGIGSWVEGEHDQRYEIQRRNIERMKREG